jgi:hypothetical protein
MCCWNLFLHILTYTHTFIVLLFIVQHTIHTLTPYTLYRDKLWLCAPHAAMPPLERADT